MQELDVAVVNLVGQSLLGAQLPAPAKIKLVRGASTGQARHGRLPAIAMKRTGILMIGKPFFDYSNASFPFLNFCSGVSMARLLVTGGCGFIGSHLVDELIKCGHHVRVLDNLSSGKLENLAPNAEFIKGDITDRKAVLRSVSEIDGVFHLAAISSVNRTTTEWPESHAVNLSGCINVLDAASRANGGPVPVIYASSAAIYGDFQTLDPRRETDTPRPMSAYGADKYGCELHARVATLVHKVPTVGLRLFNVYGPRQDPASPYAGVISIFADRVPRNAPIDIYGDGTQVRDFVFVLDAVNFFVAAMNSRFKTGSAYNVCTGQGTTISALAHMIGDLCGQSPKIHFLPARPDDIRYSVGNPDTASQVLTCKAQTTIRRGLALLLESLPSAARRSG